MDSHLSSNIKAATTSLVHRIAFGAIIAVPFSVLATIYETYNSTFSKETMRLGRSLLELVYELLI